MPNMCTHVLDSNIERKWDDTSIMYRIEPTIATIIDRSTNEHI
jgi:hypothetical protein